jgi:hypothetical protein
MFSLKKHEYLLFSGNRARDYFTGKGESVHYHQVKFCFTYRLYKNYKLSTKFRSSNSGKYKCPTSCKKKNWKKNPISKNMPWHIYQKKFLSCRFRRCSYCMNIMTLFLPEVLFQTHSIVTFVPMVCIIFNSILKRNNKRGYGYK